MEQELLTAKDAARLLGISRPTFYKRLDAGEIKATVMVGNRPAFSRTVIEQLAREWSQGRTIEQVA